MNIKLIVIIQTEYDYLFFNFIKDRKKETEFPNYFRWFFLFIYIDNISNFHPTISSRVDRDILLKNESS